MEKVTLRHEGKLLHLIGRRHQGRRVLLLVADRDVRVLSELGELLAHITIDPTRATNAKESPSVRDVWRHASAMSRDFTEWRRRWRLWDYVRTPLGSLTWGNTALGSELGQNSGAKRLAARPAMK